MRIQLKDWSTPLFFLAAAVFIILAIIGGIRSYSPVPFADMWNGYLDFYIQAVEGNWGAWWAQHNEHRILLSRIFFWLDLHFFEGRIWFLLVVNYALTAATCLVFSLAIREQTQGRQQWLVYFVTAWLFSWAQHQNLTWGFQSQFIMAQLMPLAAFYCLHRAAEPERKTTGAFILAVTLGLASTATMANGILAMPLMTLLAMLLHMSWKRHAVLIAASICSIALYFQGYSHPEGHGSLFKTVAAAPLSCLQFISLYLGGPFFHFLGGGNAGFWIAMISGFALICVSAVLACKEVARPERSSLRLSLMTFILYIGGTAFGTAGSRLSFGLRQAFESRYSTPALMVWAALFVIMLPYFLGAKKERLLSPRVLFFCLLLAALPMQIKALIPRHDAHFERAIGALSLELEAKDFQQITAVFPFPDWALSLAKTPSKLNLSIFGLPPVKDARERLNAPAPPRSTSSSNIGSIDAMYLIPDDPRFIGVRGWFFDREAKRTPEMVEFVNQDGLVVGLALTGQPRADVAAQIDPQAAMSGFKGYLLSSALGQTVELRDSQGRPGFSIQLPTVRQ
jgi:hypothetical protein